MGPTIRDIARDLGVSHATVSRVLSGRGDGLISAATRARVAAAAERLGYRRNHHARALQTGRSDAIGCLHTGDFGSPGWRDFWGRLLSGVAESTRRHGLDLVLISGDGADGPVARGIAHLQERRIDALVIPGVLDTGLFIDALRAAGAPVVVAQPIVAVPAELPAVSLDPAPGMAAAAAHLAALGHRAVTWFDLPRHSRDEARRAALRAAARANGMAWDEARVPVGRAEWLAAGPVERGRLARAAFSIHLSQHPQTTAVACYNEVLALGACAAAADLGRKVPLDLSVVGFDDHHGESVVPALTTVGHMLDAIGRRAGDLACALLAGTAAGPVRETVPAELVVRDSTGPVRPR